MTPRKLIFLLLFVIIQLCLIWPIYPLFSEVYPLMLGLPLSFAWVVLMLLASFLTLLWYYLSDPERESSQSETDPPGI